MPTILLAEDEEGVRELAQEILEDSGYQVLAAGSGVEAVRIAESHPGPIHLLLTDVVMPGMSGPDVARSVRALHPELAILYMSGYGGGAMTERGALYPDAGVLAKPFSPDVLTRTVRDALARSARPPSGG
jgi:two-component system cell cycle sensor histidine kinase/response regulator CckA